MSFSLQRQQRPIADALLTAPLPKALARVLANRGVSDIQELDYGLTHLAPYDALSNILPAATLLAEVMEAGGGIVIIGDFDADGATSTALAVRALDLFAYDKVDYLVPNRFDFGYGLSPEIVEVAAQHSPALIVTVDNGIACFAGVEKAQQLGIKVLITDHHLPAAELPAAEVIVNPSLPDDRFPSKNLAGVGVIFYVMTALRNVLRQRGWFELHAVAEPNLAQLLDLVALGTVADVVPLDRNNRILVAQGLARIRQGVCCPGISALIEVAGREAAQMVSSDLGFAVGPRLNAAGRMDDMNIGIECLLAEDRDQALALAKRLDGLNRERREVEGSMKQEALSLLDDMSLEDRDDLPFGLALYQPHWHQGVIGILASRIKDKTHRPVIAFAAAGEELKGSARSIPALHIRDLLENLSARHPDLIKKFGGHAMAAGLTLHPENLSRFQQLFDQAVREQLSAEQLNELVLSDGILEEEDLTLSVAEQLRHLTPWGQGFPEPLFDGEFMIINRRIVGEHHLKLTLAPKDNPQHLIDAIAFNMTDEEWPDEVSQVWMAYRLDVNRYQGQTRLQLMVQRLIPEGLN